MKTTFFCVICLAWITSLHARLLEVGNGNPYHSIEQAAQSALPGDTILVHAGTYPGGMFIADLQGRSDAWITIMAAPGEEVILRGGGNAIQFTDPAYLRFEGFIIEGQTDNGLNIDDAGSYETPAHHIVIGQCEWRALNATGNNDQLKLSGVDSFEVRGCRFLEGSTDGSMVDMVGCHDGVFELNEFSNAGSNCIQAKGGSKNILIMRNRFLNGGERSLNIGGSTDFQYFRPQDATSEASDIHVYSNIFSGSMAPIAYVGAVHCDVVNNTILNPEKWVVRILQETTDARFLQCGDNVFQNNLVVLVNAAADPTFNIGPSTRPETFHINNNLWYNSDNLSWQGPNAPVQETGRILNRDPLLNNIVAADGRLSQSSPAIGAGMPVTDPLYDFYGTAFTAVRSIGAVEGGTPTTIETLTNFPMCARLSISPNPVEGDMLLSFEVKEPGSFSCELYDCLGQCVKSVQSETFFERGTHQLTAATSGLTSGLYYILIRTGGNIVQTAAILVQHN